MTETFAATPDTDASAIHYRCVPARAVVHTSCCPPPCPICSVLPILPLWRAQLTNALRGREDGSLARALPPARGLRNVASLMLKRGSSGGNAGDGSALKHWGSVSDLVDLLRRVKKEHRRCHWYGGQPCYGCRTAGVCSWGFVSLAYSGEETKESVLSREREKTSELFRLERSTKLTNQTCWLHVS